MKWNRNYYENETDTVDDLSSVPSRGRGKMIASGLVVPALLLLYSIRCWTSEEALWWVLGGSDVVAYGKVAKSAAVAYIGIAVFCHSRWFWGLLPNYLVYSIGVALGLIGFICGFCCGQYFMMAGA